MKHRRVVGGPKKKNRIQEVNASTSEDRATSPLESPLLGEDDAERKSTTTGGGAVQRFLQQRRTQRAAHDHDDNHPNSIDDDDEPDNDSGDEGLTRRKHFFLTGGTVLPSTPLPPPPPRTTVAGSSTAAATATAANNTTYAATAATTPTTPATTDTDLERRGLPPLPRTSRAVSAEPTTSPPPATSLSPTSPTSSVTSPHHRPRVSSVSFSLQTTDLESGQPLLELPPASHPPPPDMDDDDDQHRTAATELSPLLPPLPPESESSFVLSTTTSEEDNDDDDDDDGDNGSFHSEADSTVDDPNNNKEDNTTTAADNQTTFTGASLLEQLLEEGTQAVYHTVSEVTSEAWEQYDESCHYDWREFWKGGGVVKFVRWVATGQTPESYKQSDDEVQESLNGLARMLSLLREYHERFGMPEVGGFKDQEYIIREVTKDLYLGGSPIWALEPVMKRVAEGLTGKRGVDLFMLPRRAFIFAPSSGATVMFKIDRGYDMQRLDDMESIAVRLASFASNTSSVASVPTRWPKPQEMRRAFRTESLAGYVYGKDDMADEILNLAAENEGLFFYIRNHQSKCYANRESPLYSKGDSSGKLSELGEFWTVEEDIRELFSRLAAIEASKAIDNMDGNRKVLYSHITVVLFRVTASACACAFWFNGSWMDILVSGILAELVAMIGSSPLLSKQERIIFEAVASFCVGFTAASVALTFPEECCFGAMAVSGVLDLLQGFRVVYSIIEIMSRHTVTGGADFLEGVFFTCLIAYCLRFGQYVALQTLGEPDSDEYMQCTKGINEWWYLVLVPLGAVAWSGLFNPHYFDLPIMAAHGILGYVVSWQFNKAAANTQMNNFLAAMVVTFSAGIVSRFTGRQALGNTVAGLYVLLPGAYLVTQVYQDQIDHFLWQIILRAIIIGLGGWTGTILCTPTLLGINKGLMEYAKAAPTLVEHGGLRRENASTISGSMSSIASGQNFRRRDKTVRKNGTGRLLFF